VRQWFSLTHVMFVGVEGGCSCGFPMSGLILQSLTPKGCLRTTRMREDEIAVGPRTHFTDSGVFLKRRAGGTLSRFGTTPYRTRRKEPSPLVASELDAPTFFFNEQFFYEVTR